MSKCGCGQFSVPKGSDCIITLYDSANNTCSGVMEHDTNVFVNNGNKLITYASMSENASFNDQVRRIEVEFTGEDYRWINDGFAVKVSYQGNIIASQYIGSDDSIYLIPDNKLILKCSNILQDTIPDNSDLFITFESICFTDRSECCDDSQLDVELNTVVSTLCIQPEGTTTTPEPETLYQRDCASFDCVAVNQDTLNPDEDAFLEYNTCVDSLYYSCTGIILDPDTPATTTTTTTCDPSDPEKEECFEGDWNLELNYIASSITKPNDIGSSPVLFGDGNSALVPYRYYDNDSGFIQHITRSGCQWYEQSGVYGSTDARLGQNLRGNYDGTVFTAISGIIASNNHSSMLQRFELVGSEWQPSGHPIQISESGTEPVSLNPEIQSLSKDGDTVVISSFRAKAVGGESGIVEAYDWIDGSGWSKVGNSILGAVSGTGILAGWDLDISDNGKVLALTCGGSSPFITQVYEYIDASGDWFQKGTDIPYGRYIDLNASGDMIAINTSTQIHTFTMGSGDTDWVEDSGIISRPSGIEGLRQSSLQITSGDQYLFTGYSYSDPDSGEGTPSQLYRHKRTPEDTWGSGELVYILSNIIDPQRDSSFNKARPAQFLNGNYASEDGNRYIVQIVGNQGDYSRVYRKSDDVCDATTTTTTTTLEPPTTTTTTTTTLVPPTTTTIGPTTTTTTTTTPAPNPTVAPTTTDTPTTTISPDLSDIKVLGGIWAAPRGCYTKETFLINGKPTYTFVSDQYIFQEDQFRVYRIFWDAPAWIIQDTYDQVNYSYAYQPNTETDTPPEEGWTNDYETIKWICDS